MSRIFAFIEHKGGVVEDTATELAAAAKKIDASAVPIAVVTGWGPELDTVSSSLCKIFPEVWKISRPELSFPTPSWCGKR